jgi:hypothetical protein
MLLFTNLPIQHRPLFISSNPLQRHSNASFLLIKVEDFKIWYTLSPCEPLLATHVVSQRARFKLKQDTNSLLINHYVLH